MNEVLRGRFGRSRNGFAYEKEQVELLLLPQKLNIKVREYFAQSRKRVEGGAWLDKPEIPDAEEFAITESDDFSNSSAEPVCNKRKGAWESKEAYLSTHFELLREDALTPLKKAVDAVRRVPSADESAFNGAIGIYEKVHVCALTCSNRGVAIKVTFSIRRAGKKILWEQSKRLITGGLVMLLPKDSDEIIVATVAARPLAGLELNPSELDLFIAKADEIEIDPAKEFVMVEDRGGLYEANRHTMLALQKMKDEPFPLSEHLIHAEPVVLPPTYREEAPRVDLTSVLSNTAAGSSQYTDTLGAWPQEPSSGMDASQLAALRRILTKRLAIIQGPPGTGKTFVSVEAIRVLLANFKPGDPPIILACQTNHAIDQMLRHIARFEPDFIRLGGRSRDQGIIKERTLYEVRKLSANDRLPGCLAPAARKQMRDLEKEIRTILLPLEPGSGPLNVHELVKQGILTQKQADALEAGASNWVQGNLSDPKQARSPFILWLGNKLVTVPTRPAPEDFGFDFEEADLEFEMLKELEAENAIKDDEDYESLRETPCQLADNFTCRKTPGKTLDKAREHLRQEDLWKIKEVDRPLVYRYLQNELKRAITDTIRQKTKLFNQLAHQRRIGNLEQDETLLRTQRIIGMTTTGLSKYRALISSLAPKIVLIEEAAETLEAPVAVACLPSLQHLILVGDHEQLRPHCNVKELEGKPRYLNVSLFERMVKSNVEYSTLSKQRRMIPEIRRILRPIYGDFITDHESVLNPDNRPNVPGMGGVNSFFFMHEWPEQRDDFMSAYNPQEADMVVGFVNYLVYNGMQTEEITVLTFYNGQRKRILKQLRSCVSLANRKFNVVTVDSYQGEENKIVLLSLVRGNDRAQIGFLDVRNRVCVALSRAQCGFYIFGNAKTL